jgi:hypothetical protein
MPELVPVISRLKLEMKVLGTCSWQGNRDMLLVSVTSPEPFEVRTLDQASRTMLLRPCSNILGLLTPSGNQFCGRMSLIVLLDSV